MTDPDRESQIEVTDADWKAGRQTPLDLMPPDEAKRVAELTREIAEY